MTPDDPWLLLKRFTEARIGLGRSGSGMPTREVLSFSMAHAKARDAVKTPIDWSAIETELAAQGLETLRIASAAPDRDTYLRRPDLGRRLSPDSRQTLAALPPAETDILIVVGDGLSSTAVAANATAAIASFLPHVRKNGWRLGPVLLATQARVALADEAAELLNARLAVMLIGERPGLSSPDSLGAYLTWEPRVGRKDGERNCISNIRAGGLSTDEAAFRLAWLLREAFRRRLTGVSLKDESDYQLEAGKAPEALARPAT